LRGLWGNGRLKNNCEFAMRMVQISFVGGVYDQPTLSKSIVEKLWGEKTILWNSHNPEGFLLRNPSDDQLKEALDTFVDAQPHLQPETNFEYFGIDLYRQPTFGDILDLRRVLGHPGRFPDLAFEMWGQAKGISKAPTRDSFSIGISRSELELYQTNRGLRPNAKFDELRSEGALAWA